MRHLTATLFSLAALVLCACNPDSTASKPGGNTPELSILYNSEEQPTEKSAVAQLLQAQLRQAGIPVRLEPVSNTLYNERHAKGDYVSTLNLWYSDYDDAEAFLTDFYSQSGYRSAKLASPEFDQLYLNALGAASPEQQLKSYRTAVEWLDSRLLYVSLYANTEVFLLNPAATGFSSNPYQYYDYRFVNLPQVQSMSDVEVQTLDPRLAYDLASKHLVTQAYETLVALDEKSRIVPSLAESWEWSPTSDRLTFRLRKNVTFQSHPSVPVKSMTSQDVKVSFQRLLKSQSPYTYIFREVRGAAEFQAGKVTDVTGFQTPDSHTFVIVLNRPFQLQLHWLLVPAASILPAALPEKFDFTSGSAGTGPFRLLKWDGVQAQYKAHETYWARHPDGRRLPLAKQLSIRIVKDVNTALDAFRKGLLDLLNVPLALYPQVFDASGKLLPAWNGKVLREVRLNNLKYIAFQMQKTPWGSSLEFRRKVDQAINRQAIVQQLFRGKARPVRSVIPDGLPGFP